MASRAGGTLRLAQRCMVSTSGGGEVLTNRAHLLSALTHGPNSIHGIIQYMCAFVGGSPSLMMLRLVYMISYNM